MNFDVESAIKVAPPTKKRLNSSGAACSDVEAIASSYKYRKFSEIFVGFEANPTICRDSSCRYRICLSVS